MKKRFHPTCRLCDKLNDVMTHCAIYGGLDIEMVDNPSIAKGCVMSGDYVRMLRAIPNEHNYVDPIRFDEMKELKIYSRDKKDPNILRNGMTLEEWASVTFGNGRGQTDASDK